MYNLPSDAFAGRPEGVEDAQDVALLDDFGLPLFLTSYLGQFWSDFGNSSFYRILDISSKRLSHPLHELTPKMPRFFAFTLILLPRVFFAVEWIEFGPSRPELLQCSFCLNY